MNSESTPLSRGVLYLKWGTRADSQAKRSIESLNAVHPELSTKVIELPPDSKLLEKARMFDLSPFDETLFLDVDTIVLDRLDFAWSKLQRFGLVCCINENPWARRHTGLSGELIEYNSGVLFFNRTMKPLFDRWKELSATVDSSITFRDGDKILRRMECADQGSFALAVDQMGVNPFVLPMNYNYRPLWQKSFFGPIKIWHDYSKMPDGFPNWNKMHPVDSKLIEYGSIG